MNHFIMQYVWTCGKLKNDRWMSHLTMEVEQEHELIKRVRWVATMTGVYNEEDRVY